MIDVSLVVFTFVLEHEHTPPDSKPSRKAIPSTSVLLVMVQSGRLTVELHEELIGAVF